MLDHTTSTAYTLLGHTSIRGVTTYRALDETGHPVMVHFLDPNRNREHRTLLALLEAVDPQERTKVVTTGAVEATVVVVTESLPEFSNLASWLAERSPSAARDEPQTPEEFTAEEQRPLGTFERLFEPASESSEAPPIERKPEPEPPRKRVLDEAETAAPGTFERLFGPAGEPSEGLAPKPSSRKPPSRPRAEPAQPTEESGGKRTIDPDTSLGSTKPSLGSVKKMSPQSAESPSEGPARSPASGPEAETSGPGEFTRLFGAQDPPSDARPVLRHRKSPDAAVRPHERDTDDILRALDSSPPAAESLARPPAAGSPPPGPPPSIEPPVSAPAYASPAAAAGASEFTRAIQASPPPAPAPAVEPSPEAEPPGRGEAPSARLLAVGLGVVLVVAIALVVFFAVF